VPDVRETRQSVIALAGNELDTEVELMTLVAGGDLRSFEQLYDRTSVAAFSAAMRIVNDRGTAADVTQEAFIELWRHRESYQPDRGAPRSWLVGIARNKAIDAYRRGLTRGGPPRPEWINEPAAAYSTEEATIARDEARLVRNALQELPAEQFAVIDLAYFGGLTQSEISSQLKLPLGTVKGRVRLAMRHLQGSLAQLA
jgi:RNA polymerase sigma factor (sigma-70 family)